MSGALRLKEWQRHRCAICRTAEEGPRGLVLDHEHVTGLVRSWLCDGCNTAEGRDTTPDGHEYESWDWSRWRRNPPARRAGISERRSGEVVPDGWAAYDRSYARLLVCTLGLEEVGSVADITGLPRTVVLDLFSTEAEERDDDAAAVMGQFV